MFKGIGNIASMIRQAQNLGSQMPAITEKLRSERVTGRAGGNMIEVTADGLGSVLAVRIDDLLRDKGDWEMVQDLLPAAINDALAKAKALHVQAMQELTGDLPIPGGLDDMLKQLTGGGMETVQPADEEGPEGSRGAGPGEEG